MSKFSEEQRQKIQVLKEFFYRLPSDEIELKNLKGFIFNYIRYIKSDDKTTSQREFEKAFYQFGEIWNKIFFNFNSLLYCLDDKGLRHDWLKTGQRINIVQMIEILYEADKKGERKSLFKAFPYLKDMLFINKMLTDRSTQNPENKKLFFELIESYYIALNKYTSIFNILAFKEHINLMLQRTNDFDQNFYKYSFKGAANCLAGNYSTKLQFLTMFVNKDAISYKLRAENPALKKFNWKALDGLYRSVYNKKLETKISENKLKETLELIANYLDKLVLFEIGEIKIDEVPKVELKELLYLNIEENIKPAFEIIEHYLNILEKIDVTNRNLNRIEKLSVLRGITAIGEAIFAIKDNIPEDKIALLEKFIMIRDHILHSSTNESYKYLSSILADNDQTLDNVLLKLLDLKPFFNALHNWFATDARNEDDFPSIPDLDVITNFEQNYANNRTKNDRDAKLTLADSYTLRKFQIPKDNIIENDKYVKIVRFCKGEILLSNDKLRNYCTGTKKLDGTSSWSKKALHKVREKIIKTNNLKKQLNENNDLVKKQALEKTINENEVTIEEFLKSTKKLHIGDYKKDLDFFLEEKPVSKKNFQEAICVLFRNNKAAKNAWNDAYLKCQKNIESYKRDQSRQLKYSIHSIELLKDLTEKLQDDHYANIDKNPIASLACEMQFGICFMATKNIQKDLHKMLDYNDKSLYFITIPHPIKELGDVLNIMELARNDLFHFEEAFRKHLKIHFLRENIFTIIQDWTHGTHYPNAITMTPDSVSRGPLTSKSNLDKLKTL